MVKVKRGRTRQKVLDDTKRKQYTEKSSMASMPIIAGDSEDEGDFVWFHSNRRMSDAEAEQERTKRGLVRDLEMQAQYNADHPEFADTHPNGDSWQADGNWHFASFHCWYDERRVRVMQSEDGWYADTWFGGRRK
mgnify:FL=1